MSLFNNAPQARQAAAAAATPAVPLKPNEWLTTRTDSFGLPVFVWRGPPQSRDFAIKLGFSEDWEMGQQMCCRDIRVAAAIAKFADEKALERITKWRAAEQERLVVVREMLRASMALDAEIDTPCPDGVNYLGYQRACIEFSRKVFRKLRKKGMLVFDDMGVGKAQPLDAKVLTPYGWKLMGDVHVGDLVIGADGHPTRVTGVYPQGGKEVFEVIFSDGASTQCCDDHLWAVNTPVRKRRGSPYKVKELKDIRSDLVDAAGNRKHYIPLVGPVQFARRSQPLPIDPYALGALLGDGCMRHSYLNISSADADLLGFIAAVLPQELRLKHVAGVDYGLRSAHAGAANPWMRSLKLIGLWNSSSDDKFIPDAYKLAAVHERVAMLQGLMDTDGYVDKRGITQFSSNSKRLADDVTFLVRSLGGITRESSKISASGKTHWILTLSLPDWLTPFRIARKVERYKPREKYQPTRAIAEVRSIGMKVCQCISVENEAHLYVTDDMVLTHNTIEGLGILNDNRGWNSALIVCPASLKRNWLREANKWLVDLQGQFPNKTIGIARGDEFPTTDIVIINPDLLARHHDKLRERVWDWGIADEAHLYCNPKAGRTRELFGGRWKDRANGRWKSMPAVPVHHWVLLSGTPIANRPKELFQLLHVADPEEWPDFYAYAMKYCGAKEIVIGTVTDETGAPVIDPRTGQRILKKAWDFTGASKLGELQGRLRSSVMIRRTKDQVLKDLPPKTRVLIELDPESGLRAVKAADKVLNRRGITDEMLSRFMDDLEAQGLPENERAAQAQMETVWHRSMTSMGKPDIPFTEFSATRLAAAQAKMEMGIDHISDILDEAGKVVVFAHHKEVIDAVMARFGNIAVKIDGSTSDKKRDEAVQFFQNDPEVRVFVGSYGAAGVGHTLTAASTVVLLELDLVPGMVRQAEDRCHRLGQTDNVTVHYLALANSIDARIANMLITKQTVISQALDHGKPVPAANDDQAEPEQQALPL